MTRARVLLADDHRIVAEGLKGLLESEFDLVGIVEDGRALVDAVDKLNPDVVVADVSMPLLNGIEAVRQIKKKHKNLAVVFLTMQTDVMYAAGAFEVGALGYVLKHSAASELVTAISSALKGRTYITPMLAGDLLTFHKQKSQDPTKPDVKLTGRQKEVLQLLAEGRCVKEVASLLGISTRTVEFHKYGMMEALGLKTSAELVRYAVKHGIVDS